jgi:hypothetical protein
VLTNERALNRNGSGYLTYELRLIFICLWIDREALLPACNESPRDAWV